MTDKETKPLEPFAEPEGPDMESGLPLNNMVPSEDRLWSALAYWTQIVLPGVMPAILLLSDQTNKNKFVRYHAIHGLALLILSIVYEIVITILVVIITVVLPFTVCATWLLFLAPFVPLIYYGIQALQGNTARVPWLTEFLTRHHIL